MMVRVAAMLGAVLVVACGSPQDERLTSSEVEAFRHADAAWRQTRIETLLRPDGWLALVSREWLEPGRHAFGSGEGVRYRFEPGPESLGELELEGHTVWLHPDPAAGLRFEGAPLVEPMDITPSAGDRSPRIEFDRGRGRFELIERNGQFALRVMHNDSPTRQAFEGLEYFPADPAWRVLAHFEAHPEGRTLPIVNVLGDEETMANPGRVVFERDGERYSLEALEGGQDRLFLVYGDRTNSRADGPATYGAGRFVYTEPPRDGRVLVDFNRGYNPPCALSAYTTCPLPPPGNRLDLAIEAGELRYSGPDPSEVD